MGQWRCVPEGVLFFNSSFGAFGGEQSLLLCCTVWYGTREAGDWLAPPVQANDPPDTLFTQFLSALDSFQWAWRLQPLDFEEVVLNCIRHSSPIRHQQFLHIKVLLFERWPLGTDHPHQSSKELVLRVLLWEQKQLSYFPTKNQVAIIVPF